MLKQEDIYAESKKCIRCGLCQAICPSYRAVHEETAVARGRNRLILELARGSLTMSPRVKQEIFACLGCEACEHNCPAGVRTPELVTAIKSQYVEKDGLPLIQWLILRGMLPHPQRFALALKTFQIGQRTKVVKTVTALLPKSLKGRMETLPEVLPRPFQQQLQGVVFTREADVAYFLSCTTNYLNPSLGFSVLKVLAHSGYHATVCTETLCCGKPQASLGDRETAIKLAMHNVKVLSELKVEAIVTDCATCGSALKQYADLLEDHSLADQAKRLAAKVYDISEFLVKKGFASGTIMNQATVTYHDPCHLNHAMGVSREPRDLLRAVPGIKFVESSEADRCCGGAGSFCLTHPDVSDKVLEPKVKSILDTKADVVATGCPMCKIQLEYGLKGSPVKVVHPVELLAQSYGGNEEKSNL